MANVNSNIPQQSLKAAGIQKNSKSGAKSGEFKPGLAMSQYEQGLISFSELRQLLTDNNVNYELKKTGYNTVTLTVVIPANIGFSEEEVYTTQYQVPLPTRNETGHTDRKTGSQSQALASSTPYQGDIGDINNMFESNNMGYLAQINNAIRNGASEVTLDVRPSIKMRNSQPPVMQIRVDINNLLSQFRCEREDLVITDIDLANVSNSYDNGMTTINSCDLNFRANVTSHNFRNGDRYVDPESGLTYIWRNGGWDGVTQPIRMDDDVALMERADLSREDNLKDNSLRSNIQTGSTGISVGSKVEDALKAQGIKFSRRAE